LQISTTTVFCKYSTQIIFSLAQGLLYIGGMVLSCVSNHMADPYMLTMMYGSVHSSNL